MSEAPWFERIVRTYGAALERVAWGYVDRAADHDDLMQDILVALWQALPNFRGESSERTFVFRVAHNRALTFLARRRRHEPLGDEASLPDQRPGPDAELDHAQRHDRLMTAIRHLPEPHRLTVMLYLDDFSVSEIATMQGTTPNNVAVRLSRARQRLKELLGEPDR